MPDLYAVALVAYKDLPNGREAVRVVAAWIIADSKAEAIGKGIEKAREVWPPGIDNNGWHGHEASVVKLDGQIIFANASDG